jgi:hypothetical protein
MIPVINWISQDFALEALAEHPGFDLEKSEHLSACTWVLLHSGKVKTALCSKGF